MTNKNRAPHFTSGRSPSAAVQKASLLAQSRHLVDLLQNHLAIPTLEGFLAAHAKALDSVPIPVPGVNSSYVPLVGPTTPGKVQFERSAAFSPEQRQRLDDVVNDVMRNPQLTLGDFFQRASVALDRVPLGEIFITTEAAASRIPAQTLYLALHKHRRCREDNPASEARPSGPLWIRTSHHEPDGAWPEFVVVTDPDGCATMIGLLGEVRLVVADPSRN